MIRRLLPHLCVCWVMVCAVMYYLKVWELLWGAGPHSLATPILGALLILASAYFTGAVAARMIRWRPENWREGVPVQIGLGLGVISYFCFGLALLHKYSVANVRLFLGVLLFGAGAGLIVTLLRGLRARLQTDPELGTSDASARGGIGDRRWRIVACAAILLALIAALAPEIEFDALAYHLWLPKLWLQQHAPVDLVQEMVSLLPMTWELLYGAAISMGGTVCAKLLHFACLPLIGILVYEITRRYFTGVPPWLSVAYFCTIPTVFWEATTAYIDLALTFHTALALFATFRYLEARRAQWLLLAGVNTGLAMATKHLGIVVAMFSVSYIFLYVFKKERRLWAASRAAAVIGVLTVLFPAPWYMRSWRASGNPVFPLMYRTFGARPAERWDKAADEEWGKFMSETGRPRTLGTLATLPWDMTMHSALYAGSLGPMFLLILPGLAVRRRQVVVLPAIGAFVLFYLVLWASPAGTFHVRYLLPATPFLALLAAEAQCRLSAALMNGWRTALNALVCTLLILNLPPFISLQERDRVEWRDWLGNVVHTLPAEVTFGAETEEAYLAAHVRSYGAWQYINSHLPQSVRILTYTGGDNYFSERQQVTADVAVETRPATWAVAGFEEFVAEFLHQHRITHILFDKRRIPTLSRLSIGQPLFFERWLIPEYEDAFCSLFRVREGWR